MECLVSGGRYQLQVFNGIVETVKKFDKDVSHIVGESNLGKSNALDLLNAIVDDVPILSSYGVKTDVDASDSACCTSASLALERQCMPPPRCNAGQNPGIISPPVPLA